MSRTVTVTGAIDAVDTRTLLTGQGSVAAPSLVVPVGMTKIIGLRAAIAADALADDGSYVAFIRLGGAAVRNGEQVIVFAGGGNQTVQSGSDAAPSVMGAFVLNDVDIDVTPSDVISIAGEIAGVDPGDTQCTVTLVYGK